jgi:hypothetical protein
LIRGAYRSEVEAAFPGWEITDVEPSYFSLPKLVEVILRPEQRLRAAAPGKCHPSHGKRSDRRRLSRVYSSLHIRALVRGTPSTVRHDLVVYT